MIVIDPVIQRSSNSIWRYLNHEFIAQITQTGYGLVYDRPNHGDFIDMQRAVERSLQAAVYSQFNNVKGH